MKIMNVVMSKSFVKKLGLLKRMKMITIGKIQRSNVNFAAIPSPAITPAIAINERGCLCFR